MIVHCVCTTLSYNAFPTENSGVQAYKYSLSCKNDNVIIDILTTNHIRTKLTNPSHDQSHIVPSSDDDSSLDSEDESTAQAVKTSVTNNILPKDYTQIMLNK